MRVLQIVYVPRNPQSTANPFHLLFIESGRDVLAGLRKSVQFGGDPFGLCSNIEKAGSAEIEENIMKLPPESVH